MSRTVGAGLTELCGRLTAAGIDAAPGEARRIMAASLNVPADRVSLMQTDPIPQEAEERLANLTARRCAREPLSHILGLRAFYRHEFHVTADVLDPRPETETLVKAALEQPFETVLDLGTGTGCILLSLLAEREGAHGLGIDISEKALIVARRNSECLGLSDRSEFRQSDWYDAVKGTFDLIVSNPPYISTEEMETLAPELRYEPRQALTDEADGLSAYRSITKSAASYLVPGGRLLVEIGWTQGAAVSSLFQQAGFESVRILRDLDGRDRVVCGVRPAGAG